MSGRIIIVTTLVLLLASFAALFAIETKNHDPDFRKSWSVVYFKNPGDKSLDFVIENHQGEAENYEYKLSLDGKKEIEGKIEIEKGSRKEISPVFSEEKLGKSEEIEISVGFEDTDYKIYKNIK